MALTDKLTAIANALRSKTGGTAQLTLEQIASGISGLDTSGSGGTTPTVPDIAKYWQVGTWATNSTAPTATTSRAYLEKKMASGVSITNNTGAALNALTVSFDSNNKATAVSSATSVADGASKTFTDTSAHHLYVLVYRTISVMGTTSELRLNANTMFSFATNIMVTGTEVS